MKKKEL